MENVLKTNNNKNNPAVNFFSFWFFFFFLAQIGFGIKYYLVHSALR